MNQYNNPYFNLRRELVYEALEKYPDHGNMTVAKLVFSQHPEYFTTLEHARSMVRMYRGCWGERHRIAIKNKKYFRNVKPIQPT